MSDNRNIISNENWVYLYSEISNWILENKSLDPIWTTDKDGNEVRTKEKQDEYLDIADEVEAIMETVLTKESDPDDFTYTGGDSALLPDETGERADIEYIQTETGIVPKDLTDTIKIRDYIHHQIDVITDSDWFDELVEQKVREALAERRGNDYV